MSDVIKTYCVRCREKREVSSKYWIRLTKEGRDSYLLQDSCTECSCTTNLMLGSASNAAAKLGMTDDEFKAKLSSTEQQ